MLHAHLIYVGWSRINALEFLFTYHRWRHSIQIICGISWLLAIPMFFVPEPIRNETNRLGALEDLAREEATTDRFAHLAKDPRDY